MSVFWQNAVTKNHHNTIGGLLVIGLLVRICAALIYDQIHHPDELFQYLEQAHRIVFGYGYIPWEYRFAARSWILPGVISPILYLCKILRIDDPVLYVNLVKVFFCFISTSLIYSAYIIGREISSNHAGILASIFVCFWYELIYFASRPTPEVLATYLFTAAFAIAAIKNDNPKSLLFGLFCALTIILRVQYAPLVSFIIIYVFVNWKRIEIVKAALIFFVTIWFAGYIDYLTWGEFFISYYNYYIFNTVYNVSILFGTERLIYYPLSLAISSMGMFCVISLVSFIIWRKTWLLLLLVATTIILHSLVPHKEYRFIVVAIPMFLILLSITLTEIPYYRYISRKIIILMVLSGYFIISLAGSRNRLPFQAMVYKNPVFSKKDLLNAYLFLFKERDLYAILTMSGSGWTATGGYYYLHRNVPIYFKQDLEVNNVGNYLPYISHIICDTNEKDIFGFEAVKTIRSIEIRRQVNPSRKYQSLAIDTKNVLQKGIDDVYESNGPK